MYVLHSALITKVSFGFMNLPVVSAHGHTTQPTHINVSTFDFYYLLEFHLFSVSKTHCVEKASYFTRLS